MSEAKTVAEVTEKEIVIQREQLPVEFQAILSMIERVVLNPEADMDKLDKMLDMQERVLNRNAKQAFTADLAAMQTELPLVAKNGKGHNSARYALLEDINEAIRPALKKYGFAVTFRVKQGNGYLTVTGILSHKMCHSEETDLVLPLDTSGNKNDVQSVGSTISYGKRYVIAALLNISTGDDNDGGAPKNQKPAEMPITSVQIDSLRKAMTVAGKMDADVCKKAGIEKLEDLQQGRLKGCMDWLQKEAQS